MTTTIAFLAAMIVGIPTLIESMKTKDENITTSAVISYHLLEACAYAIVFGALVNLFEIAGAVIEI